MKKIKSILIVLSIILLSGCALPLQSTNYPAWKTKNLIKNNDSNSGFMGLYVGDTAHATDFDITITSAEEVVEMMLAGASAVEIGAANLVDPFACKNIIEDLPRVCKKYGITNLKEITGGAH